MFSIAHNIFVQLLSRIFSICFISIHVVHRYSRTDTAVAWKKLRFFLSGKFDFHMIDNLSIAVHALANRILTSFFSRWETASEVHKLVHSHFIYIWENENKCVKVRYLSVVHVLNYVWKWIVTWASGREDYMCIRAFHHAQMVLSIPSVLIGCEPRSGYASMHICWPTHWHLFVSQRQLGRRAGLLGLATEPGHRARPPS